jgi:small subunit ribosomal protein S20
MANTKSAKKEVRKNEKRRFKNLARRTSIKTAAKKIIIALDKDASSKEVDTLLSDVAAQLARAKGKGVIHRNAASRKLSRLAKKVKKARTEKSA